MVRHWFQKKEIYFISSRQQLTAHYERNHMCLMVMKRCLHTFKMLKDNEQGLIDVLTRILSTRSSESAEARLFMGQDPQGLNKKFIDKMGNLAVIVMSFQNRYVVLDERLAIQYIHNWCYWHSFNEAVIRLRQQLKAKYHLKGRK